MAEHRMFLLYDARARLGSTDDATVLDTAASEKEAQNTLKHWPEDSIWFEAVYDDKGVQVSEKPRYDLSKIEGRKFVDLT